MSSDHLTVSVGEVLLVGKGLLVEADRGRASEGNVVPGQSSSHRSMRACGWVRKKDIFSHRDKISLRLRSSRIVQWPCLVNVVHTTPPVPYLLSAWYSQDWLGCASHRNTCTHEDKHEARIRARRQRCESCNPSPPGLSKIMSRLPHEQRHELPLPVAALEKVNNSYIRTTHPTAFNGRLVGVPAFPPAVWERAKTRPFQPKTYFSGYNLSMTNHVHPFTEVQW